ncbi:MAG TPA: hypothetical protein VMF31_00025 [Solirubrobacterales bacterium]|nr:hypothetical protein [Solirubrobacterales bacterium]
MSSAQAINVVSDSQVVTGAQCVGDVCSTDTPVAKGIVVSVNDTPYVRLDQAAGGGFSAQTWDVAGNEANFFIRDLTSGSKLPFRIFPGTLTDSLTAGPDGIGIGTRHPASLLELNRNDARITVTDASDDSTDPRVLADLVASGAPLIRLKNGTPGAKSWVIGARENGEFSIRDADGTQTTPDAFSVAPDGTATVSGILQQGADASVLGDRRPIDAATLLGKLRTLPVTSWTTPADSTGARHIGPTGNEFRAAFGVGSSDQVVAPGDLAAVGLVAIQQLAENAEATGERVKKLEQGAGTDPALADRVKSLEALTRSQAEKLTAMSKKQGQAAKQLKRLQRQVKMLLKRR